MYEQLKFNESFKTMKIMTRIAQLSVLLVATFSMSAAMACTTSAWSAVTGNPAPLDGEPEVALPRISGTCAMTLTAAGSVKDTSPAAETKVFIRFYVLGDISSDVIIFEAFSNDSAAPETSMVSVTFDGTNFVFDAGVAPSADVPGKALIGGKAPWNMIQLSWLKNGTMAYTVNGGTDEEQAGTVDATDDFMESVVLGSVADPGGTLIFDDYESHRETAVDGLLIADGNSDDLVDVADIVIARNEALGRGLASGTPDCTLDGEVDVADIVCTRNTALGR